MQKRKNQIRNTLIVLLNILLVISLFLVLGLKNNYGYALYWFGVPFLLVLTITVLQKWSVRGLNADYEESKVIQKISYSKSTKQIKQHHYLKLATMSKSLLFKEQFNTNLQTT